jgi:cholesterol transport system auxiliary component
MRPDLIVSVREPVTSKELAGAQLVMQQPGGRVAYLARAEWTDAAPALLQTLWIATLERSGKIKAGVRSTEGVRATCDLAWDLHAFDGLEAEGGDLSAHIAFSVRAIDPQTRQVRAQRRFESSIPSQRNRTSIAAKLGEAARTALAQASAWVLIDGCPTAG